MAGKLALDIYQRLISFHNLLIIGAGTAFSVFFLIRGQTDAFMLYLLFIAAGHDADFEKMVKIQAVFVSASCFIIWMGSFFGVIESTARMRVREGVVLYARNGLGFREAYHISYFLAFSLISWVYLRKENISWYELMSLAAIYSLVFFQTDTRGPYYLSLMVIVSASVLKVSPQLRKYRKIYKWAAVLAPLVCGGIIIFQGTFLSQNDSEFLRLLNLKLTNRIQLNYDAVQKNGFSFFGSPITWYLADEKTANPYRSYNWVDSVYLYSLLSYGILFMAGFFAMTTKLAWDAEKKGDTYMILALVVVAILGMWDNYCFRVECNPFYLMLTFEFFVHQSVGEVNHEIPKKCI